MTTLIWDPVFWKNGVSNGRPPCFEVPFFEKRCLKSTGTCLDPPPKPPMKTHLYNIIILCFAVFWKTGSQVGDHTELRSRFLKNCISNGRPPCFEVPFFEKLCLKSTGTCLDPPPKPPMKTNLYNIIIICFAVFWKTGSQVGDHTELRSRFLKNGVSNGRPPCFEVPFFGKSALNPRAHAWTNRQSHRWKQIFII